MKELKGLKARCVIRIRVLRVDEVRRRTQE